MQELTTGLNHKPQVKRMHIECIITTELRTSHMLLV